MTDAALDLDGPERTSAERERLAGRWLELTRTVLPGMAAAQGWPIRFDHCFMRVCLDAAIGRPWHEAVRRPAVRNLELHQLRAAVAVAEGIAADPGTLPPLNEASLAWRRAARQSQRPPGAERGAKHGAKPAPAGTRPARSKPPGPGMS